MTVLTKEEKQLIIDLENSLLRGHLTSDSKKKIHSCRYCGNTWKWYEQIIHHETCPITMMNKFRRYFDIPNWIIRGEKG